MVLGAKVLLSLLGGAATLASGAAVLNHYGYFSGKEDKGGTPTTITKENNGLQGTPAAGGQPTGGSQINTSEGSEKNDNEEAEQKGDDTQGAPKRGSSIPKEQSPNQGTTGSDVASGDEPKDTQDKNSETTQKRDFQCRMTESYDNEPNKSNLKKLLEEKGQIGIQILEENNSFKCAYELKDDELSGLHEYLKNYGNLSSNGGKDQGSLPIAVKRNNEGNWNAFGEDKEYLEVIVET